MRFDELDLEDEVLDGHRRHEFSGDDSGAGTHDSGDSGGPRYYRMRADGNGKDRCLHAAAAEPAAARRQRRRTS